MDNENLKSIVKKLERDILSIEVDRSTIGTMEKSRSNSVHLNSRQIRQQLQDSKKYILNPFLKTQNKLEV